MEGALSTAAPQESETGAGGKNRLNPVVFFTSSALIVAVSAWAMIDPVGAGDVLWQVVAWVSEYFGWYYFLTGTLVVVFVIALAASRYGKVKLGPDHAKPDFSVFAWAAMLFAAGIGIDLMFYSVAEPVTQFLQPPVGDGGTVEAARQAIVWTLFHYGITGWAMYTLMGLALAFFAFRYRLPLTIRSALYPIFGKRIHGPIGDAVDIAAVLGTVFGVAVSLGIGVAQLNFGLNFLFGVPQTQAWQIALIAVAVVMATASAVSGIDKGIRILSEINVVLAIGMVLYVMIVEGFAETMNKLVLNVGDYVSRFPFLTMDTFGYDQPTEWLNTWTLFFWAWWVAWAPFVGLFLAKISRGRTIRQFVAATMVIPFLFTLLFLAVFGNAAIDRAVDDPEGFGANTIALPEQGFYTLLDQYPGVTFIAGLATFVGLLFYVTSADSGAIVLGNFTSKMDDPTKDADRWQRIYWSVLLGVITLAMLTVGGITALQGATIIMGLPFSFVMYLVGFGLWRALRVETYRAQALRTALPGSLSERSNLDSKTGVRSWRQRISRASSFPGRKQVTRYVDGPAKAAFTQVATELDEQGCGTNVVEDIAVETGIPYLELQVDMGTEEHFSYAIWAESAQVPGFALNRISESEEYWRLEVYLNEGNQGYDVMGYTEQQLIGDILDHYERHLEFLRISREAPGGPAVPDDLHFGDTQTREP
ncbi:choline BCCT transporter BetT [Glycomyces buryatensis]|uniref:BCCT family transporter n=1 Tax=Glycomyces buryatensis TaxID=2570927 RepID=A0A4S8QBE8_9ACTN|nr:BCCT family transporter [Glycomyces buryatensis]